MSKVAMSSMLYLDPSPTPGQDRADSDLKLGLFKALPVGC